MDKVRIPVIFAFFCDMSLVVAAFECDTSRPDLVIGHSRNQKVVCLVMQGLSCFVVARIHPSLGGSHIAVVEQSYDNRLFLTIVLNTPKVFSR